jgi:ribonuclease P protein component
MLRTIKGDKKIETLFEKGFLLKEKNILLKGYDFGEEESFFGVSVSKKFFKSAVTRNKIKRQLKAIVRKSPAITEIKKGVSFFIIYSSTEVIDFKKLKELTEVLLEKLKAKAC